MNIPDDELCTCIMFPDGESICVQTCEVCQKRDLDIDHCYICTCETCVEERWFDILYS